MANITRRANNMIKKTVLKNGVIVITEKNDNKNLGACLSLNAGGVYESSELWGISHFVEHLMFDDNSFEIEKEGGYTNGCTFKDNVIYMAALPKEKWTVAIDFLYEVTSKKSFCKERIELEKKIVIDEYIGFEEYRIPTFFKELFTRIFKGMFNKDSIGTEKTINSFTPKIVDTHINNFYQPDNMVLSVAGNVEHKDVVAYAKKTFGKLEGKCKIKDQIKASECVLSDTFIDSHNIQSKFALIYKGVSYEDNLRLRIIQELTRVILGVGISSRLHQMTRALGLGYVFQASSISFSKIGYFNIYGRIDPSMLDKSISVCRKLLHSMKVNISEEDLERAKKHLKYSYYEEGSSVIDSSIRNSTNYLAYGKLESEEEYMQTLNSITLDSVYAFTRKYFAGEANVFAEKVD